jgi:hypothetical protein
MKNKNLKRITGLWIKKDKNGEITFTFKIEGKKYLVFANMFATEASNKPSHILYQDLEFTEE